MTDREASLAGVGALLKFAPFDLFDVHLPLLRYEQQPGVGLAVRKYVLKRRGVLDFDTQRAPAGKLTDIARHEVDYLLDRLARHDKRAQLSG